MKKEQIEFLLRNRFNHVGDENLSDFEVHKDEIVHPLDFTGCHSLKFRVPDNDATYDVEDGALICKNPVLWTQSEEFSRQLVSFPSARGIVRIPDGVDSVKSFAFSGCADLEGVIVTSGVKEINYGAFAGCKKLKKFTVENNPNFITLEDGKFLAHVDEKDLYIELTKNYTGDVRIPGEANLVSWPVKTPFKKERKVAEYFESLITSYTFTRNIPPAVINRYGADEMPSVPIFVPEESVDEYKKHSAWSQIEYCIFADTEENRSKIKELAAEITLKTEKRREEESRIQGEKNKSVSGNFAMWGDKNYEDDAEDGDTEMIAVYGEVMLVLIHSINEDLLPLKIPSSLKKYLQQINELRYFVSSLSRLNLAEGELEVSAAEIFSEREVFDILSMDKITFAQKIIGTLEVIFSILKENEGDFDGFYKKFNSDGKDISVSGLLQKIEQLLGFMKNQE